MATKRPAPESSAAPPAKRSSLILAPLDIGPAAGEEDLDIKVLKVQNGKLSERLREKNHRLERQAEKIRQLEEDKDAHTEMMSSFKHHFGVLRDHLLTLLAQQGKDDDVIDRATNQLGDAVLAQLEQPDTLSDVFESINQCLVWIQPTGSGRSKGRGSDEEEESESDSDEENVQFKSGGRESRKATLVLEQLQKKWRESSSSTESHLLGDKLAAMETKCEQLEEKLADTRFDLQKSQSRNDHLEVRLADALEELQKRPTRSSSSPNETEGSTPSGDKGQEGLGGVAEGGASSSGKEDKATSEELEQLQGELTESQTLADSRLKEIKDLSLEIQELKKTVTQLELDQKKLPDSAIADSAPYKTLQTQFSIAVQEAGQLRACLDEARQLLATAKQQHIIQLEEIRGEENKYQVEVREEMGQLEAALLTTKRDYELLRIEFERTVASNEQAAPIARELQVTVDSLQKSILQLKGEVTRYKTRAHKAEQQLIKEDKEKSSSDGGRQTSLSTSSEPSSTGGVASGKTTPTQPQQLQGEDSSSEDKVQGSKGEEPVGGASIEEINKLKDRLAKLEESKRLVEGELETLQLATGKEEREKADILAAEKKARAQIEDLKKKFEEYRKDYERRKDHIREESGRKVKSLMEDNKHLQKELSAKRHEAQALMAEMESTAQAFEEMQEQNIRLLQQLKEKDDANFKLMSERIKSNSIQKLLLEEKDVLHSQLVAINTEKQRLAEMIGQLEERERNSEVTIQTMDKELTLKQQAVEMHKSKALESVQGIQEWQLKVNDLQGRVENAESALKGKVEECEKEGMAAKRCQEEVGVLKRKLDKYKSREWMASSDEVLLEEIKTYKAKLNCPCCSTRKKDTVLTKCFHVFCSECIRSRYDSRLRKCPKCGAAFGANDFHKIYLS